MNMGMHKRVCVHTQTHTHIYTNIHALASPPVHADTHIHIHPSYTHTHTVKSSPFIVKEENTLFFQLQNLRKLLLLEPEASIL